jgi:hypothetical protein
MPFNSSNGNVDTIEMKKRFRANDVDCIASSSFKNIELADENTGFKNIICTILNQFS